MVKNYYQILGVRQGAGMAEIRRAYRMLAQKLHPDVNPDPTAHALIREVNEAYDVLSDEAKKLDYDNRLAGTPIQADISQQTPHRDPRYRRPAAHRRNPASGYYTQRELMQQYLPYMLWFCFAGILFVAVLFMDKVLPAQTTVDEITKIYVVYRGKQRAYAYDIIETKGGMRIKLYDHNAGYFYDQKRIKINNTPILKIATTVYREDGNNTIRVGIIYRTLVFLPIVLLSTSALGVLFKRKIEFSFSLSIISGVLLLINLYLI